MRNKTVDIEKLELRAKVKAFEFIVKETHRELSRIPSLTEEDKQNLFTRGVLYEREQQCQRFNDLLENMEQYEKKVLNISLETYGDKD